MADLLVEVPTTASWQELAPRLKSALDGAISGGLLRWTWEEEAVHLAGGGAQGSIVLVEGKLVGRATLGPPASLLKDGLERRLRALLEAVAGGVA